MQTEAEAASGQDSIEPRLMYIEAKAASVENVIQAQQVEVEATSK